MGRELRASPAPLLSTGYPGGKAGAPGPYTERMPWLDEEIERWDELSEEERRRVREMLRDLGADLLPDDEDPEYFE